MKAAAAFVGAKWAWAKRYPLAWSSLALVAVTIAVLVVWPGPIVSGIPSDSRLRLWALVLQVLGGLIALADLSGAAKAAGHPGVWGSVRGFVREAIRGRHTVIHPTSGHMKATGGRVRVTVRSTPGPEATVTERLAAVEANLSRVDTEQGELLDALERSERELKLRLAEEANQRAQAISGVESRIKSRAAGNFGQLAFGAFWVLVGAVLSGLSQEVVRVAAGQWRAVFATF